MSQTEAIVSSDPKIDAVNRKMQELANALHGLASHAPAATPQLVILPGIEGTPSLYALAPATFCRAVIEATAEDAIRECLAAEGDEPFTTEDLAAALKERGLTLLPSPVVTSMEWN